MFVWLFLLVALTSAQRPVPKGFPTPLQMCQWSGTVYKGQYNVSALFLSTRSVERNEPELLFYTTSGSSPSFSLATAGFDTGIAWDLGAVALKNVNFYNVTRPPYKNTFTEMVVATIGHTYGIWTFHQDIQALWAFSLDAYDGTTVKISYTVMYYQYVTDSKYVVGKYDDHPTNNCHKPAPLPTPLETCKISFTGTYNGNYTGSALFLSPLSVQRNTPELLYGARSGSRQSFDLQTAGFDVGAAFPLGPVSLSSLNYYSLTRPKPTPFETWALDTQVGHTYGVWTFHQQFQGLWAFRVDSCSSTQCNLSYTVIFYQAVTNSDYVIGNYNAYPQDVCTPV